MWRFWRTRLSWHGSRVPQREVRMQRESPPVWTVVAEWLSLPPALDRLLWQAMSRSETPSVVRWRATLLDAQPDSAHDSPRVDRLLQGLLSPHRRTSHPPCVPGRYVSAGPCPPDSPDGTRP